jgi:serine/threonine protein phosphatase PrpC
MSESGGASSVAVEVFARTDVGCVRTQNEDAYLVMDLSSARRELFAIERHTLGDKGSLFVVCDGMGGAAAGEVASALAVEVVASEMSAAPPAHGDHAVFARLLRRAVRMANRRLYEEALIDAARRGMGTTLSAGAVSGRLLVTAQVGDSRAYLYRSGVLTQVTRDQSVVSALVQAGRLTPDEARTYAHSNVILQALGVLEDVEVSLSLVELRRGDRLLVCSDGLHGTIDDLSIQAALDTSDSLRTVCDDLIGRARDAGAPDNVTVILARFDGVCLDLPTGPEDLPKFLEFDPAEEGERSLTTTSRVARRLAARAGVGKYTGPQPLPPTGQHSILSPEELARAAAASLGAQAVSQAGAASFGPATAAMAQKSRLGTRVWWILALALAVAALLFVWRGH